MRKRVVRISVVLALLGAGAWAAVRLRDLGHRATVTDSVGSRIDRLQTKVAQLGLAQAGYLVPGQDPVPSLERFPVLLGEASAATAELGPLLRSADATRALQAFADSTAKLAQSDGLARDSLLLGDALTASHIISGESKAALDAMHASLTTVGASDVKALEQQRAAAVSEAKTVLGGVALFWLLGVLVLVPGATDRREVEPEPMADEPESEPEDDPQVDIGAVAKLCMEIARVQTPSALDTLMKRAKHVLGASRVLLWMGSGEELFPVVAHAGESTGSSPPAPVPRASDHPAARAWRLGELQIASAREGTSGSILAPMIGPSGCTGVLAVDIGSLKGNSQLRAAVVMIAAQLSTVVGETPRTATPATARASATGT
jgi:hypothetical protein